MRFRFATMALAVLVSGCDDTIDRRQQRQQEQLQAEADRQVGLPNVTNFTEKKLVATLYELRDRSNLPTFTYTFGIDGMPHFLCRSVGFGVPYSTQFSNPEKQLFVDHEGTIPQAEPNGLFMPASAEGTWIMMATKDGPKPLYIEQRVAVSVVPLPGVSMTNDSQPPKSPGER